jgi:hypothetical protein
LLISDLLFSPAVALTAWMMEMKKFSPDQMIFALALAAVIAGLTIYRLYTIF